MPFCSSLPSSASFATDLGAGWSHAGATRFFEVWIKVGSDDAETLRLGCALVDNQTYLLRFGEPGKRPIPFRELEDETLEAAENHIREFLQQSCREIIVDLSVRTSGDNILFEGEGESYVALVDADKAMDAIETPRGARAILRSWGDALGTVGQLHVGVKLL